MHTDTAIFPKCEFDAYQSSLKQLELEASDDVLLADLGEKKLFHVCKSVLRESYPVSSGARPRSCNEDSLGTPWGLHVVSARHGQDEPAGMVFHGRIASGVRWQDYPEGKNEQPCLVTTRILRLRGLEPGLNSGPGIDTHDRYIYIHGTNHPERFPENTSSGCLVMRDDDLIQLFDRIPEGSHVWLSHP